MHTSNPECVYKQPYKTEQDITNIPISIKAWFKEVSKVHALNYNPAARTLNKQWLLVTTENNKFQDLFPEETIIYNSLY